MTLKSLLLLILFFISACGSAPPSNQVQPNNSPSICKAPMVPAFTAIKGSQNWLYDNGQTITPYQGFCNEPGR